MEHDVFWPMNDVFWPMNDVFWPMNKAIKQQIRHML
jgi:hypothetical protein